MKTYTAKEARKLMVENPGRVMVDKCNERCRWNGEDYCFEYFTRYLGSWGIAGLRGADPYSWEDEEAQEIESLKKEIEELKKRKTYQWKNCAERGSITFRSHAMRRKKPFTMNSIETIGFFNNGWRVNSNGTLIKLSDPEIWEFLELEE